MLRKTFFGENIFSQKSGCKNGESTAVSTQYMAQFEKILQNVNLNIFALEEMS